MIDKAVKKGRGNITGKNQNLRSYTRNKELNYTGIVDNVNNSGSPKSNNSSAARPTGNSESAALRRLRKDRLDLHAQVIAGEMSAHAAMVKAGFRPKTVTVPIDIEKAARVLVKSFQEGTDNLIKAIQKLTKK